MLEGHSVPPGTRQRCLSVSHMMWTHAACAVMCVCDGVCCEALHKSSVQHIPATLGPLHRSPLHSSGDHALDAGLRVSVWSMHFTSPPGILPPGNTEQWLDAKIAPSPELCCWSWGNRVHHSLIYSSMAVPSACRSFITSDIVSQHISRLCRGKKDTPQCGWT